MAEATTSGTSSTTPTTSTPSTSSTPVGVTTTTILATAEDGVLQPDSMRGSEQYLQGLDIIDLEQDRRDIQQKLSEKPTTTK